MPYFHHFLAESVVNNKCCNYQQSANNNSMLKQVKAGYLLHFKKRLFGKAWREEFVALYEDSSLIWFRDRDRLDPEGGVFLRDAPEMLAAGQWISRVPSRPEFPAGCDPRQAIAIGARNRDKVHWFLCKSESELIDWMSAISHTLPPPPPPPEELRQSRRNLAAIANAALASSTSYTSSSPQFHKKLSSSASTLQSETINGSCYANNVTTLGKRLDKKLTLGNDGGGYEEYQTCQVDQQQQRNHQKKLSEASRSYSTGKLIDRNGFINSSNLGIMPMNDETRSESKRSAVTFKIPDSDGHLGKSVSDITAGITMAGVLTQMDTSALAADYSWDWGMGWGWSGYSASYCSTCAMEQAALINSNIGHGSVVDPIPPTELPNHSQGIQEYLNSYDGDDEIGEIGGEADVGCDFGDFGF